MTEQDHVRAAELREISFATPGSDGETLSLSDASIIAVSERLGANVLTGDTYWSKLSEAGHLKIKASCSRETRADSRRKDARIAA